MTGLIRLPQRSTSTAPASRWAALRSWTGRVHVSCASDESALLTCLLHCCASSLCVCPRHGRLCGRYGVADSGPAGRLAGQAPPEPHSSRPSLFEGPWPSGPYATHKPQGSAPVASRRSSGSLAGLAHGSCTHLTGHINHAAFLRFKRKEKRAARRPGQSKWATGCKHRPIDQQPRKRKCVRNFFLS